MATPHQAMPHSRVRRGRAAERLLRLGVPERMNQRDAAIDLLLRGRIAGRRKMRLADVAEIGRAVLMLRVRVLGDRERAAHKAGWLRRECAWKPRNPDVMQDLAPGVAPGQVHFLD